MKKVSYSERFTREDGSISTLQPVPEKDAGIVAIYYYTSPEFARNYSDDTGF